MTDEESREIEALLDSSGVITRDGSTVQVAMVVGEGIVGLPALLGAGLHAL